MMNVEDYPAFDAIEKWVEEGKAPDKIIYSHRKSEGQAAGMGRSGEVYRTRPTCPFPQEARYNGSGDINDAANFSCK